MSESLLVVIPSRARVGNMRRMMDLLPQAVVCVAEQEAAAYREALPPGHRLMVHPNIVGLAPTRNWILDNAQEDCVVMVDDDLRCV